MPRKNSLAWSPEQVQAHNAKVRGTSAQDGQLAGNLLSAEQQRTLRAAEATKRVRALGRLKSGEMNKTEAEYGEYLKSRADIVWCSFEGMKFRLADSTFYTPDFIVMLRSGELQAHEVKGHWQDDARVKIKVAASMFPLKFLAVKKVAKKDGGGWKVEEFNE